ncbi:MAG: Gfo/Idh/MocA family oxidoreductase [Candidatus Marinimicrobia bacterium]|nr:Gfo/Idh/MocA family oxidoreductase [Candidatus Neomarinimicrobiota bacterium]
MTDKPNKESDSVSPDSSNEPRFNRRDIIRGLATIPALAVFLYSYMKKSALDSMRKLQVMSELNQRKKAPAVLKSSKPGELIRLGVIGYGWRGAQDLKAAGFASPEWVAKAREGVNRNRLDKRLETYLSQEDLNLALTGVCDVFDTRREQGIAASTNDVRPGGAIQAEPAKEYRNYQDLLASDDIDAVIVTTPDHWHAQITIDALRAGKHVYCEKCMTRTMSEAIDVYDAVKKSGLKFQLGHHSRASASHEKAKEIIENNILGQVTLVEVTTNRNSPGGAWVYPIQWNSIEDAYLKYSDARFATPKTLDWNMWQGPAPNKHSFNLERYFRWRCWYDYGTGLSGDLLSHDFDAVNQIMDLGIPKSASASGGIYYYTKERFPDLIKEDRDVPDTFQAVFEYPDRGLTLVYSASLANSRHRGKVFMGHDATMEVGSGLTVTPDPQSTRYKSKIEEGIINTALPLFSYSPGSKDIDGITSASAKYFAQKGLVYTYREGKRVDPTHLHVKDWLDCIRYGGEPKCNIEEGFEEAVACHMATESYLKGRTVEWDPVNRKLI